MLKRRATRGKEIAERLAERRGIDPAPRPEGTLIWLHAASVGETMSILPVIARLARRPDPPFVLVTTGTLTSAELLASRLAELAPSGRAWHRFVPLDVPAWTRRFLDHWRPDAVGFVESEIWPNLLGCCVRRHIPLMLINARLSGQSFDRWRRLPRTATRLFGAFSVIQAQSQGDADRLGTLLGLKLVFSGNLKFAAPALPATAGELSRLARLVAGRPIWLAASTHPGEERLVVAVHQILADRHPGLLTIIAPRHPHRGAEVAALAGGAPLRSARQDPPSGAGVWVADTMGEMGLLYRIARVVFVGGSLVAHGGQNPLEPARLGCAVAVGPNTENFTEAVAILRQAGGLSVVADTPGLASWVDGMLRDPGLRRVMGEAGLAAARGPEDLPEQVAATLMQLAGRA
jgi:3-deoxy-D-manno-octulosonic-acid transferase